MSETSQNQLALPNIPNPPQTQPEPNDDPLNLIENQKHLTYLLTMTRHVKRIPKPLIAQELHVSIRTIDRYLEHARDLLKEDPIGLIHDFLAMNDDLIRETWLRFQNLEINTELSQGKKEAVRSELLMVVNNLMRTRWEAIKALSGAGDKSTTLTILKGAEGFALQLKEEPKSVKVLMEELLKEKADKQ